MRENSLQNSSHSTPGDIPEKRKPGRPSTGKALSRADIQRQYRLRNKSNVTKNTVNALDENIALRAQLLQVMDELDAVKKRARVEFELGEKARARVRELERLLAAKQKVRAKKAPAEARYELQCRTGLDGEWILLGPEDAYRSKSAALAQLRLMSDGKEGSGWRVLDRKTGTVLSG
ncbi:hypothetical protein ALP73_01087 [Pseudomonas coronafaciens pv. garcae]|uniref:hypothetical protein n=1 Tax=Pseudomonas syringae group TaxID=136849 RepID=UPI000EFDF2A8|nr:hypothetical protein [Pseudomonas coronafaciens]RMS09344.1 hypothetical protein ALP73_01087 [Pseudomonas coronafaciens pv. garcae]